MPIYSRESKLKDVIIHDVTVIPLFNRFNIFLGVEDFSIEQITQKLSIDTDFFLNILNTYVKDDFHPSFTNGASDLKLILEFLEKTDRYYENALLPTIERHFRMLVDISEKGGSDDNNNIKFLWKFFQELKDEMISEIHNDKEFLFPFLRDQINNGFNHDIKKCEKCNIVSSDNAIEDKVNDLVSFFIIHLKGNYNPNLLMGVITSVFTLDKEIKKNNRIRKRFLLPLTDSLSKNAL